MLKDLPQNQVEDVAVGSTGLEMSKSPSQVLAIAGTYITTQINAEDLPTS